MDNVYAHRGLCQECKGNLDDLHEDEYENTSKPKVYDAPHDDKEESEEEEIDNEENTCIAEPVHIAAVGM